MTEIRALIAQSVDTLSDLVPASTLGLLMDRLMELVGPLVTELGREREKFAYADHLSTVVDDEWSKADDECAQLRAELAEVRESRLRWAEEAAHLEWERDAYRQRGIDSAAALTDRAVAAERERDEAAWCQADAECALDALLVDALLGRYDIRERREAEPLPEWQCPSCGATTRARMADHGVSDGAGLIAAERRRHKELGWTAEHDDQHRQGQLGDAAACYAANPDRVGRADIVESLWPWSPDAWKPTPDDRIHELARAGALLAAEIDRQQRLERGESS